MDVENINNLKAITIWDHYGKTFKYWSAVVEPLWQSVIVCKTSLIVGKAVC